jgi:membrane protein
MEGADTPVLTPVPLDRLPRRLRPVVERAMRHWLGRFVVGCMTTTRRIELFDRSMTIAAQIFTSVLPILIALASWFGRNSTDVITASVSVPPDTEHALEDVLAAPSDTTFGVIGVLVVLISATSLSRALTRACAAIWELPRPTTRLSAAWRWVAVVLALALSLVAARQLHKFSEQIPPQGFWDVVVGLAADVAIVLFVPTILLAGAIPLRRLAVWGFCYAAAMFFVRPVSTAYLPRALDASAERYGSIGVAFTYLAWLYVVAFVFLASGVVAKVVVSDEGRLGAWLRGDRDARSPASGDPRPTGAVGP